jgi:hypothetical protein
MKTDRWAPHDIAYWNPGDRNVKPDQALLLGNVTEFLRMHPGHKRAVREGLAGPPRGPVAGVAGGEMSDLKPALTMLERRGFIRDFETDLKTYPHGAKEGFVWNPAYVELLGSHHTVLLRKGFSGRRTGRDGPVQMPPKYVHLREVRSKATGRTPIEGVIHLHPSAQLNATQVQETAHSLQIIAGALGGPARIGGDFNYAWDSRHAQPLHQLAEDWDVSQTEWEPVGTFRLGNGRTTAIDWAMWRERQFWRPIRQVVIDMPYVERVKGHEHYALVIETSLKVRPDWKVNA